MKELWAAWFPGGSSLTAADLIVFAACLAGMTAVGRKAAETVETPEDYLLGSRRVPWIPAALALVAAEVSALTVIGVPAAAFREDWGFLQFFVGAAAARALVAVLFVPAFFRGEGRTIYGYLGDRFGPWTRTAAAGGFVASRLLISGVRLLAACAAAGALLGWGPWPALALFTVVALAALVRGGAPAAVWTGAFQALVLTGVGVLSVLFLLRRVDGGPVAAFSVAAAAGKFRVLDPATSWAALLTGFFGSLAAFGTDHEFAQKLTVVRDAGQGRRAMALSVAGSFLVLMIYLLVGSLLFVFYKQNPGMALPERMDRIFPHFAATAMSWPMRGLVLSAIVLASIDAPLASLSAVVATDLWRPSRHSPAAELAWARGAAVASALVLAALAALFAASGAALSFAFKAGGVASGPMLGAFALGLTSGRRGDRGVFAALAGMVALGLFLLAVGETGSLPLSWTWLTALGAVGTYALAWALTRPER